MTHRGPVSRFIVLYVGWLGLCAACFLLGLAFPDGHLNAVLFVICGTAGFIVSGIAFGLKCPTCGEPAMLKGGLRWQLPGTRCDRCGGSLW
jgi:hypothetical protein